MIKLVSVDCFCIKLSAFLNFHVQHGITSYISEINQVLRYVPLIDHMTSNTRWKNQINISTMSHVDSRVAVICPNTKQICKQSAN